MGRDSVAIDARTVFKVWPLLVLRISSDVIGGLGRTEFLGFQHEARLSALQGISSIIAFPNYYVYYIPSSHMLRLNCAYSNPPQIAYELATRDSKRQEEEYDAS